MDEAKENNRHLAVMINNIDIAQPLMGCPNPTECTNVWRRAESLGLWPALRTPRGLRNRQRPQRQDPIIFGSPQGMDAVYMHSGGSEDAYAFAGQRVIDEFDLDTDMMWRDEWRRENLGYEHSVLTSGELLEKQDRQPRRSENL